MSVLKDEWIWERLHSFVDYGLISEKKADRMELEEAYEFISDSENKRDLDHCIKWGISEGEAKDQMVQESYRW